MGGGGQTIGPRKPAQCDALVPGCYIHGPWAEGMLSDLAVPVCPGKGPCTGGRREGLAYRLHEALRGLPIRVE